MDREIDSVFDRLRDSTMKAESIHRTDVRPYTNEVINLVVTKPKGFCITFIFHGVDYVTHFSNVDLTFKHDGHGNYMVSYDLRKYNTGDMESPMQSTQATFNVDQDGFKQVLCGSMACTVPCFHNLFISLAGYHANLRSFIEFAWKQHKGMNMIVIECIHDALKDYDTKTPLIQASKSIRDRVGSKLTPKDRMHVRQTIQKKHANVRTKTNELTELLKGLRI